MDVKAMLQKMFIRYGVEGAHNPSPRGCYEPVVPDVLKRRIQAAQLAEKPNEKR